MKVFSFKNILFIFILAILLLTLSMVIAENYSPRGHQNKFPGSTGDQNETLDNETEGEHNETDDGCIEECSDVYTNTIKECNSVYNDLIHQCNDNRENSLEACGELKGEEKRDCVKNANIESKQCKKNARTIKYECKQTAREERKNCFDACEAPPGSEEILCCAEGLNGECFLADTIESCRARGWAVMDCMPPLNANDLPTITDFRNETHNPFNTSNPPYNASDPLFVSLANNVTASGVNNTAYVPGSYECANFAGDLEANLTARGYNATFTAYWCHGGPGNPPPTAHAITDVHLSDGRLVWIEPQTNRMINMDMDGDGIVEYNNNAFTNSVAVTTDDNCQISVWENRAQASAAGVPGA
ncbi:MAG: hypothetical protein AABX29_04355 [Nanoarchaeota archaeon]